MKFKLLSLISLLALLASCNFLDETSPNDIDADTAIRTAAEAENALIGLYSALQKEDYYGGSFPLVIEALGGNCTTGGFDNPLLNEIGDKTVTASNGIVENLWLSMYGVIANCNRLLAALPGVADLDDERRGQIEGQARAIRALVHFDLLRSFGYHWDAASSLGIPLVDKVVGVDDRTPRATVAACYDFVIDELKSAAGLVDPADRSVQYLNAAAVHGLLARVYLYKKDYAAAAAEAGTVIGDGAFDLLKAGDFPALYTSRRTSESVFELAFDNQNRSAYNALTYSRPDALRTELFYLAAPELNTFFAARPGDLRAALVDFDPANHDESITSDGSGRTQKYRGEDTKDNPAYILRLAELYLVRAEAGGLTNGVADLNFLRTARGLADAMPADEAAFLDAVLDERRAELNFEGHMLFDLARTGRVAAVLGDDFRAVLPIPQREITATNEVLVQNPGY